VGEFNGGEDEGEEEYEDEGGACCPVTLVHVVTDAATKRDLPRSRRREPVESCGDGIIGGEIEDEEEYE
jgi:hypothetical protein